jgi:hypothetical protein
MNNTHIRFIALFLLFSYLLAACGGALPARTEVKPAAGSPAQVEFAGTVDAINGDQWVVNGQTFNVGASTQVNGNFQVGDSVKVSATVNADGSVVAREVQASDMAANQARTQDQTQTQAQTQSQDNGASTPEPDQSQTQSQNQNESQAGAPSPEFVGTVEAINGDQWTIGGQVFTVTNATGFKDTFAVGDMVKVHVVVNPDGTFTAREVESAPAGSTPGWDDNGNGNSNGNENSNDDSMNGNSNDDNSNANNSNDDKGDGGGGKDENSNG